MATFNNDLNSGAQTVADDDDSIASNITDDGEEHLPEKILAEQVLKHVNTENTWYLVKWENCPILRSSWESGDLFIDFPHLLADWKLEQQRRTEGKSKFDLKSFNQAVQQVEKAEVQRRRLRRLRKDVARTLSVAANP